MRRGDTIGWALAFFWSWSTLAATPTQTQIRLQASQFFSQGTNYYGASAAGHHQSLDLSYQDESRWTSRFYFRLNLANSYSQTEEWNYVKVHEANVEYRFSPSTSLTLGRKLETWASWEDEWMQGVFQPRQIQNKMRMEQDGLIGLFFTQGGGRWSYTLGALPVHVPDFGVHTRLKDHQFYSANPWFKPPVDRYLLNNELGDIRYSLNAPRVEDVVLNPGGIVKLEHRTDHHQTRVVFAYKPMPSFLLGFPSENRVWLTPEETYLQVEIHPRVLYHRVSHLEHSMKMGPWTWNVSVTHENPVRDDVPSGWTTAEVGPVWIHHFSISRPLNEEGPQATRLGLSFLKIDGDDVPDRGVFASDFSLFERRYHYHEAYSLHFHWSWRAFASHWRNQLRMTYDRLQNGGGLTWTGAFQIDRQWNLEAYVDWLGLFPGDREVRDGMYSIYRANDRVGLGMSYVF